MPETQVTMKIVYDEIQKLRGDIDSKFGKLPCISHGERIATTAQRVSSIINGDNKKISKGRLNIAKIAIVVSILAVLCNLIGLVISFK